MRESVEPLLPDEAEKTDRRNARYWLELILPPVIGVACAAASTAVFWQPSINFVRHHALGKWLAARLGEDGAFRLLFSSAAPDVAALVLFSAMHAVPNYIGALSTARSTRHRVGLGSSILVLALMQSIQYPAGAWSCGGRVIDVLLTGVGGIPNALFAATDFIRFDIPQGQRALHRAYLQLMRGYDCWRPNSSRRVARLQYALHDEVINRLNEAQKQLRQHKRSFCCSSYLGDREAMLALLANATGATPEFSWKYRLGRWFVQAITFFIGLPSLSMASILGMVNSVMPVFSSNETFNAFAGTGLSLSLVYIYYQMTVLSMGDAFDVAWKVLTRQPINTLGFELNPRLKAATLVVGTLWSSLSFYAFLALLERNYNGPYKEVLDVNVSIWAVVFHVASIMHCFDEVLKYTVEHAPGRSTRSVRRRQLLHEAELVNRVGLWSPASLAQQLSELEPSQRGDLGEEAVHLLEQMHEPANGLAHSSRDV